LTRSIPVEQNGNNSDAQETDEKEGEQTVKQSGENEEEAKSK
jgi:hypothetical protein